MTMEQKSEKPQVAIIAPITPDFLNRAETLAKNLGLPLIATPLEGSYFLFFSQNGLSLNRLNGKNRSQQLLFVDFVHGKNGYRLIHNLTIKQPLARAVGIKSGVRPQICDGTAGLGGDAFALASLGCTLHLFERNPIMAALLEDGLERARQNERTKEITAKIHLRHGESSTALCNITCDTIYLDPMYPHTDSSAEKKIAMRILRDLVGDDEDSDQLMEAAEAALPKRIVVKRPSKAPSISAREPQHTVIGKSCRYDIYFREALLKN